MKSTVPMTPHLVENSILGSVLTTFVTTTHIKCLVWNSFFGSHLRRTVSNVCILKWLPQIEFYTKCLICEVGEKMRKITPENSTHFCKVKRWKRPQLGEKLFAKWTIRHFFPNWLKKLQLLRIFNLWRNIEGFFRFYLSFRPTVANIMLCNSSNYQFSNFN